jgi:tetratricopeptide (TPR) repeat protein
MHYSKALQLQPNSDKAHANLGAALLKKGQTEEAVAHLQDALRINPNNDHARAHLMRALAEQDRSADHDQVSN